MGKVIAKGWSCKACETIWGQPRTNVEPHEFLVLRRPGASAIYQCLVCHTNSTCELREAMPRWRALPAAALNDYGSALHSTG